MKYLESGRAAILFLKVGFVVFAILFCCFVLEPEHASVADVVHSDDGDCQVTPIVISPLNIQVQTHAQFRLPFGILSPAHELIRLIIQQPKVVPEFVFLESFFLSLPTINAP